MPSIYSCKFSSRSCIAIWNGASCLSSSLLPSVAHLANRGGWIKWGPFNRCEHMEYSEFALTDVLAQ